MECILDRLLVVCDHLHFVVLTQCWIAENGRKTSKLEVLQGLEFSQTCEHRFKIVAVSGKNIAAFVVFSLLEDSG